MSIDDKFLRDPRVLELADRLGVSKQHARGALLDVFAIAYDRVSDVIPERLVDRAAEHVGFAKAMVECELAAQTRAGIRIRGAAERLTYLQTRTEAGRAGGLQSGEKRRLKSKQTFEANEAEPKVSFEANEARLNPPDPVPDSASAPDLVLVPDKQREGPPSPPRGVRSRKARQRATEPTGAPHELAIAYRVLDRLSGWTDVEYRSPAHAGRLIARLRDGYTERDLRSVVGYCADPSGLGWSEKENMRPYLRPGTLFGPEKIQQYIDEARAWANKHYPAEHAELALVSP